MFPDTEGKLMMKTPPKFLRTPSDQTGVQGGVASFVCQATGDPRPKIVWNKKGKRVSNQRFEVIEFDDGSGSVLRIQPLRTPRDEAIYECVASNSVGEISATTRLNVLRVQQLNLPVHLNLPIKPSNQTFQSNSSRISVQHINLNELPLAHSSKRHVLHTTISLNPMTQLDRLIGGVNRYAFTLKHIIASANTNDECKGEWLEQCFSGIRQIYVIGCVRGFLAPRNSTISIMKNLTRSTKSRAEASQRLAVCAWQLAVWPYAQDSLI
ncbi:Receptor-type tyrosine-protein phosphatase delta [Bagarius yarrelli]|uniref:Receptor-type tyrosine-protein phosphatase delta n=1 Tax=Bagarius yarrelli TaxID=175774 RepID=A0A556TZY6_BAGYA|nr:Receptor-type tyrosine-protein phosphatase delta [Bagarius yarrelli]